MKPSDFGVSDWNGLFDREPRQFAEAFSRRPSATGTPSVTTPAPAGSGQEPALSRFDPLMLAAAREVRMQAVLRAADRICAVPPSDVDAMRSAMWALRDALDRLDAGPYPEPGGSVRRES